MKRLWKEEWNSTHTITPVTPVHFEEVRLFHGEYKVEVTHNSQVMEKIFFKVSKDADNHVDIEIH